MAQQSKYIDLRRTYLPIDPESFPESQHDTSGEDRPEERIPVMAYEGWNFMPTSGGYRSYFGLNATLDFTALASIPDEVFVFQTSAYANLLIALCNDGIYKKDGSTSGAWTQLYAVSPVSDATVHYEWTYCIINQILYIYRQGYANGWKIIADGTASTHTPDYLTMSGQMGIFKAGGRLGIWDSSDAVAWSSYETKTSFTPDIATQANVTTFTKVIGRIVTIKQMGDGFVIYATKSIVRVKKANGNVFQWESEVVSGQAGIAYPRQVTVANPDTTHYAWTSVGLMIITEDKSEIVVTEVFDFLKECQLPIYLKMLEGRYLFVEVPDGEFVYGNVSFSVNTINVAGSSGADASIHNINDVQTQSQVASFFSTAFTQVGTTQLTNLSFIARGDSSTAPVDGETYPSYLEAVTETSVMTMLDDATGINPLALIRPTTIVTFADGVYNLVGPDFAIIDFTPITADSQAEFTITSVSCATITATSPDTAICANTLIQANANAVYTNDAFYSEGIADFPLIVANAITIWNREITWMNQVMLNWKAYLQGITRETTRSSTDDDEVIFNGDEELAYKVFADTDMDTALGITEDTVFPISVDDDVIGDYFVPSRLSEEQYRLISDSLVMFKSIQEVIHWQLRRTIRLDNVVIVNYADSTYGDFDTLQLVIDEYDAQQAAGAPHSAVGTATGYEIQTAVAAVVGTVTVNFNYQSYIAYELRKVGTLQIPDCEVTIGASISPQTAYTYDAGLDSYTQDLTYTPDTLQTLSVANTCVYNPIRKTYFNGYPITSPISISSNVISFNGTEVTPNVDGVDYAYQPINLNPFPSLASTFLLQAGSVAPINPTMYGAYVYDTQYKKWGKLKADYKVLLDFSPVNIESSQIVPYTRFGVTGALVTTGLLLKLFDANPSDSYIKYGKVGLFRLGMTTLEEVIAQFRLDSTCTIETETSLDGKSIESGLTQSTSFTSARKALHQKSVTGKWHNITIRGQFDLTYLEFKSRRSGRR